VKDEEAREEILDGLLKLTTRMPYGPHQDYDNFRFFYAWKFSQRADGRWFLLTQPRYLQEEPTTLPPPSLDVPALSALEKLQWNRALALRKALAIARIEGQINLSHFRQDWAGQSHQSVCWSPRPTE